MVKQQNADEIKDLLNHADKYLDLVISFFKGMQDTVEDAKAKVKTEPASTWASATDDVTTKPEPEPQTEDVFDLYIEQLERRAYEHSKRGEINATAAIRRIINELRALDNIDETP